MAVRMVVLDEADRMLDMGFVNDINKILDKVPKHKQTSLFSATMDQNIWKICNKYMDKPEKILVSKDEITLEQIDQRYVKVDHMSRQPILQELINEQKIQKALIFTKTKRGAYSLAKKLKSGGYNANALHGDLTQPQRDKVTQDFRKRQDRFPGCDRYRGERLRYQRHHPHHQLQYAAGSIRVFPQDWENSEDGG